MAGGTIEVGSGDYGVIIHAQAAYGATSDATAKLNTFYATLGSGKDTLVIDGSGSWGLTSANVTAGSGTASMAFTNTAKVKVRGGSGSAIVTGGDGGNTFVAGTGSLEAKGGSAADTYVFHAGAGSLTIDNFSVAEGDTIQVDASLKGSMSSSAMVSGVVLSFGSGGSHQIALKGLSSDTAVPIHWI